MFAPDEKVFDTRDAKLYNKITSGDNPQNAFMRALRESQKVKIKEHYFYCLGFDLPHHFLWIAYLLMRFKPDRWGGDVIIAPGYDEIQEEERKHGPLGAMVDNVLPDKDK